MRKRSVSASVLERRLWIAECAALLVSMGLLPSSGRIMSRVLINRFGTVSGRDALLAVVAKMPTDDPNAARREAMRE